MERVDFKLYIISLIFTLISCSLEEPDEFYSPSPGFLQVYISSDSSDTDINILGSEYSISAK